MTTPIILFSDAPSAHSGLARICRDLATQIHHYLSDDFRIATLGYGSPGSSKLPFMQYHWTQRDDFLPLELPYIVEDFCHNEPFILMTIGDIQRFLPLADGKFSADRQFGDWITEQRQSKRMKLWGYFPIDAHSVGGKLGPQLAHTLTHYDRRLVPSEWALDIVKRTLPNHDCDCIPHGIDVDIFHPHDKKKMRGLFRGIVRPFAQWPQTVELKPVPSSTLAIGIIATNQSRKDWALGIETIAELKKSRDVLLWAHTDAIKREWSILELLSDFGLLQSSIVTTGNLSDEMMSWCYSALDLTLSIDRGAGFNYPAAESLACGVPVVAGAYGAHSDFIPDTDVVAVDRLRLEGPLNLLRPIYDVEDWEMTARGLAGCKATLPDSFAWRNVWPRFESWFREGIKG